MFPKFSLTLSSVEMASSKFLIFAAFFASLWAESFQLITIKAKQIKYEINPDYGKVFECESNETFFGNQPVKIFKNISAFQFTLMLKSSEGKVMMTKTVKPCERKKGRNLQSLLSTMYDVKIVANRDNFPPFLWMCPITEGDHVIPSRPREINFPLMVPSFFTTPGSYDWQELYETKENGNFLVFLKITKTIKIVLI